VNYDLAKYQLKDIQPLPPKKRKGKLTKLELLQVGERFEIVGFEESFRGLYVTAISDCAITIRGFQKRDEDWVSLGSNYSISTGTRVRPL
jgi:hypothetical protein